MARDEQKERLHAASELRRQAEERLRTENSAAHLPRTGEETQRLVHELEVHQIELEMQNAELRQARDEVESALEKYLDLYEFAPVGYFTLNRDGLIRAVNLAGASILEMERSGLLGRRFGLFVAESARPAFTAFLERVFTSSAKEACESELLTERKHLLFVQVEAVASAANKECRVAVIDITERRRAEASLAEKRRELEELNRTLEMRITQNVEELRQKDQMLILQDRLSVMGEMINNIAHQWRQPLNTLGLITQELPLSCESGELTVELVQRNSGRAMELIRHMSRTIDDFRNFFKPDKEAVPFRIDQVIASTLSLIEKSFKDQGVTVVVKVEDGRGMHGYPNEYGQVLLNILMNARDALVGHDVGDARIVVHSFAEGDASVVTITDNAGGIAEDVIGRIFDPYFSTKGPDKGTGLGLFMSRTIVEKSMGGRLTVRNTGSGAEFRIEI